MLAEQIAARPTMLASLLSNREVSTSTRVGFREPISALQEAHLALRPILKSRPLRHQHGQTLGSSLVRGSRMPSMAPARMPSYPRRIRALAVPRHAETPIIRRRIQA